MYFGFAGMNAICTTCVPVACRGKKRSQVLWNWSVLVRVTTAVMKHYDQSNSGIKGFIWPMFPHHRSSLKKFRIGTQIGWEPEVQELKKSQRNVAYCLLLSLFSYRTQNHEPRDGSTHNGPGPPTLITNSENAL